MTDPLPYYSIGVRLLSQFLRIARFIIFCITDSLVLVLRPKKTDTALIVRLDAIGDAAVWFQSGAGEILDELKRTHSKVILIANCNWAELASALEAKGFTPVNLDDLDLWSYEIETESKEI